MSNDVTMHCPDAGLLAVHLLAVDSDQALCSVLKTSSGSKLIISKWAPRISDYSFSHHTTVDRPANVLPRLQDLPGETSPWIEPVPEYLLPHTVTPAPLPQEPLAPLIFSRLIKPLATVHGVVFHFFGLVASN